MTEVEGEIDLDEIIEDEPEVVGASGDKSSNQKLKSKPNTNLKN